MINIWKIMTAVFIFLFLVIFVREHYPLRIYHRLSDQPVRTDVNPYKIVPFKYYILQKRSLFEKLDCSNKIVFIGDSLTDGCEWNELLGRTDIINRGINADTTGGVLNRLNGCLLQKPKGIFITVGTNDIYRGMSMAAIQSNYAEIIKNVSDQHIPLFVQSTLYTNFFNRDVVNAKVTLLNDYLERQCRLRSIQYIDLNRELSDNRRLSKRYSNDGLHLNGDGYMVWKKIITPHISIIN